MYTEEYGVVGFGSGLARCLGENRKSSQYGAFYKQNFLSFYVAGFHTPAFSSIPHFPTATPPPIPGMSGDLSASVVPRGGAFVLANMTNPHLSPPSPVGG